MGFAKASLASHAVLRKLCGPVPNPVLVSRGILVMNEEMLTLDLVLGLSHLHATLTSLIFSLLLQRKKFFFFFSVGVFRGFKVFFSSIVFFFFL